MRAREMGERLKTMGEGCPKLLLELMILNEERDRAAARPAGGRIDGAGDDEEEKRLELKLGLPGGEDPSLLSLGSSFSKLPSCSVYTTDEGLGRKEFSDQAKQQVGGSLASGNNEDRSQARPMFVPAVGWPPIRSYRRNLVNPPKPSLAESKKGDPGTAAASEAKDTKKGFFVKINMDGVPIGRKVDLYAYDCYEKLSLAVDDLFSGLLAAQRDPPSDGAHENPPSRGSLALGGLMDGSGEYTLVYEDNEGDRMLVGDVPWVMFVSAAKRLRVLKSSELPAFSLGGAAAAGRKRAAAECC